MKRPLLNAMRPGDDDITAEEANLPGTIFEKLYGERLALVNAVLAVWRQPAIAGGERAHDALWSVASRSLDLHEWCDLSEELATALAAAQRRADPMGTPVVDALDEESAEWMSTHAPLLMDAIQDEIDGGRTPDEIYRLVARSVGADRQPLAMRCRSAARHLAASRKR